LFWTLGDAWRQNPTLQFFLATGLAKGPPTSIFLAMTPSTVKNLFLATRAFPPIKYGDTATQYSNTPAVAAFCTFGACACPAALSPPPCWQKPTCHQQGLNGFERVFGELQQRPNFFGCRFGENRVPLNFIWLQNLAKTAMQFCPIRQRNYLKFAKFGEFAN
jgi:hypothetical protein